MIWNLRGFSRAYVSEESLLRGRGMEKEIKVLYPRSPAELLALISVAIFQSFTERPNHPATGLNPDFPEKHPQVIVSVTTTTTTPQLPAPPPPPTPAKDDTSYDDY
jgi:hypothetical protein